MLETASSFTDIASAETNTFTPGIQALLRTLTFHDPSPDTDLLITGVLDSVTLIQLVAMLEKEFDIVIPMDEVGVESFRSVAGIAELVAARRAVSTSPTDQFVPVDPRVELAREIQDLIQETFSVRVKSTEDDLFGTGIIDSIILVQLILRLEERFSLDLVMEDLDLDDFTSVATIAAFVESCFKKAASAAH